MPLQAIRQLPWDAKHYDLSDGRKQPVQIAGRTLAMQRERQCELGEQTTAPRPEQASAYAS
jgi:hypothetical protein